MFMLHPNSNMGQFMCQNFRLLLYWVIWVNENLWDTAIIRKIGCPVGPFVTFLI